MTALYAAGQRVVLVPPKAYITPAEAFDADGNLRGDVIGDGTPDGQGRVEIRTIDPDGQLGAAPAGVVVIVGANPKPGRQRRYVLLMDDDGELSTDENCLQAEG